MEGPPPSTPLDQMPQMVERVRAFVDAVTRTFRYTEPVKYNAFLRLLRQFQNDERDAAAALVSSFEELFRGHPELMERVYEILPEYRPLPPLMPHA